MPRALKEENITFLDLNQSDKFPLFPSENQVLLYFHPKFLCTLRNYWGILGTVRKTISKVCFRTPYFISRALEEENITFLDLDQSDKFPLSI